MTTTQLAAGRELDALIAETVMGLEIHRDGADVKIGRQPRPGIHSTQKVLAYSTDIAAAWLVIEKMREYKQATARDRWAWMDEAFHLEVDFEGEWSAGWVFDQSLDCSHWVSCDTITADTAPLAICRAALAAIKEEPPYPPDQAGE